jgi:hypothetical protein
MLLAIPGIVHERVHRRGMIKQAADLAEELLLGHA